MACRGKPIAITLRVRIRAMLLNGVSQRSTAKALGIARETVRKYSPKRKQV